MKEEKTTLIKPQKIKEKENERLKMLTPLILLIIGIILFTNSDKLIILICYVIGFAVLIFGIYNLIKYYRLKKELNFDDNTSLVIGGSISFLGILIILLASAIEIGIRYIIGFGLIYNGYKKLTISFSNKNYITLTEGIILILLGLYSILAKNIVFTIIGLLLIISSIIDLINLYLKK